MAKISATPSALAVSVAVCIVLTGETLAVKLALVAPAGTATDAGTVTAELLLAKPTVSPPLAAAAFRVTAQRSVPAPVTDRLAQLKELRLVELAAAPVPLSPISSVPLTLELLVIVNWPVAAPVAAGEKFTLKL
jgi:hypothetical protein